MRAFISLELPSQIKKEIGQIQAQLEKAGIQVRWVRPEITHLTLAFLGSITPNRLQPIEKILEEVASQIKPAKLKLSKLGFFPSPEKARIIYVDLSGEVGKLNALSIKIRKRLKKEEVWFDKKPFVAHVTLGRVKKRQNLAYLINRVKMVRVEFVANQICLNKSTLTESGPVYEKLKCVSLA